MGVRFPAVGSNAIVQASPPTTTETVICTTPPLNISLDFAQVQLFWLLATTAGTGQTSFQLRLRRGTTIAGTQVNVTWTANQNAAAFWTFGGCYIDTPGAVAGQQYSLTYQGVGNTGNSTISDVCLIAYSL